MENASELKDFTWTTNLVVASGKSGNVCQPVVNLDLQLNQQGVPANKTLEFTPDELKLFIEKLEKCLQDVNS